MKERDKKEWKKIVLRDICDRINYGYTASAKSEKIGPKFLRITDIVPELIDWESATYCEIDDKKIKKYLLKEGDIVIARTGANTGYAKYIKNQPMCVFASYLVRIRINEDYCARYIGHVVESEEYKRFIKSNLGGSAQPHANAQVLTSFTLWLPPFPTQRKISSVLSAYDDLIENNNRRIQILEEMAQTIYKECFVKFRFPGHEDVKMVDSGTDFGMIPEGWEVKRLGDVCNIVMGQSPKSKFYNEEGEGLPFHQGVRYFGSRFPEDKVYCTVKKRLADVGDILFSVRAPVGRINISRKKIVIGRGLCAIRSKQGYNAFIFQQLKELFKEEDSMGGGTIFKSVTKKDMHEIKIVYPNENIIKKFESILKPVFSLIENLQSKIDNLRRTRDLLLPRLIPGEIDVSNLDIDTEKVGQVDLGMTYGLHNLS